MYKKHLFICTNSPDKQGKCGNKNSEDLRFQLKQKCKSEAWSDQVRVNSSGCLGYCEKGIVAVMYPEGKWYFDLKKDEVDKLFKDLKPIGIQNS